jgi:type II secretory pathway pseudopilin PulG
LAGLEVMRGLLARFRNDSGFTLVAVMGTMSILTVFLLASLAYAMPNLAPNRRNQDSEEAAAVAAAQAGIDDFISRLNGNDSYWLNNSSDKFASSGDTANAAFSTAGVPIPGTGSAPVSYKYSVISASTQTTQTGIIRLQSTGKSRNASRTLIVQLQPSGFLRYIYFTDAEVTDPALYSPPKNGNCGNYYYDATLGPRRSSGCSEIQFTDGDEIKGPLHSNDALQINGATLFSDPKTESSWPDGSSPAPPANHRWWGTGTPSSSGYQPTYHAPVVLPAANSEIQNYADPTKSDSVAPGCQYTGQTRIRFSGNQMFVLSPGTTSSTTKARCYNYLTPNTEQRLSIPPVIYVQNRTGSCAPGGIGYPMAGENWSYSCSNGDAFVQGTATGQVTVATANDIIVTGDLKTTTNNFTGTDVIGLVANNYVWVYHPTNTSNQNLLSAANSVHEIDAAVLSVAHSFVVQNWNEGAAISNSSDDSTKLTVKGAIAQKYRGPVGTGSATSIATGYLKNYIYDPRLMTLPPPYFLKPVSAPWGVTKVSE